MITIPECFYRISVKALILDEEGRFLLIREDNGMWDLPGGGLDHGELPHQGLNREMQEEMGIVPEVIADDPAFFFTFTNPKGLPAANVIYRAKISQLDFIPSAECVALRFIGLEEVENLTVYPNIPILVRLLREVESRK
ncbi:NUDIX hydrolase [Echinicola strongylocentroti]|uniref:NUDIX hydrolase n=1 Tax=Echinicola strongylocentroti TaxID=1795355 RepID=A0A2Z4ILX1_9BACT|nr:NUDIX hydrolase [Echinicola strongylocentroti]AWW32121.1 NUDIX hydrolase [Echinicola strongylocentroti]